MLMRLKHLRQLIYICSGEPLTYSMLRDLSSQLRRANSQFNVSTLELFIPSSQSREGILSHAQHKRRKEALTNIIQLVRYALGQIGPPRLLFCSSANQFLFSTSGTVQLQRNISDKQIEVIKQVVRYIASANGAVTYKGLSERREECRSQAAQLVKHLAISAEADKALCLSPGFANLSQKCSQMHCSAMANNTEQSIIKSMDPRQRLLSGQGVGKTDYMNSN